MVEKRNVVNKVGFCFVVAFLLVSLFSSVFVEDVGAVSYYNWVENPSFIDATDYCEDGGFESGSLESGETYGNWTEDYAFSVAQQAVDTDSEYSGVYGLHFIYDSGTPSSIRYVLSETYNETLGADFSNCSVYLSRHSGATWDIVVGYSDSSNDEDSDVGSGGSWQRVDFTDLIDDSKFVIWFEIQLNVGVGEWGFIDDCSLLVDDGGGQDSIDENSEPWYKYRVSSVVGSITLYDDFGRLDDTSVRFHAGVPYWLSQDVMYLDVENVHFLSLYGYSPSLATFDMVCRVDYADGSYDIQSKEIGASYFETWGVVNFGVSFLDDNKFIAKISFYTSGVVGTGGFYIDDVGLWADVSMSGYQNFDYVVSPTPISKTPYGFSVYQNVDYQITAYKYDENGNLTEEGEYLFIDALGRQEGDMENGTFTVLLSARGGYTSYTEVISFQIVLTGEVFVYRLSVYWQYSADGADGSSGSDSSDAGAGVVGYDSAYVDMLVLYLLLFVPSLILAVVTKSVIGFMAGLSLGMIGGLGAGLLDMWMVIMMGIILVALLLVGKKLGR